MKTQETKQQFGLLNGLFAENLNSIKKERFTAIESAPEMQKETKRTWKIRNSLWDDFLTLVATTGKTQAEIINDFIEAAIIENRDKIEKYKEITGQ